MKTLLAVILIAAAIPAAQQSNQKFTGIITDSMCPTADHSGMRMGPTNAECTNACVYAHGALYVLYDGKNVYTLSDQKVPEKFAGQKVNVTGTLDAKTRTIRVDAISALK